MERSELQSLAGIMPKLAQLLPELHDRPRETNSRRSGGGGGGGSNQHQPTSINSFLMAYANFMRAVSAPSSATTSMVGMPSPSCSTTDCSSHNDSANLDNSSCYSSSQHSTDDAGRSTTVSQGSVSHRSAITATTIMTTTTAGSSPPPPIVFFMDNAERVDVASLQVLRMLVTDPKIRNLLVVLAFSPVEIDHPLNQWLKAIESVKVMVAGASAGAAIPAVQFCPVVPSPLNSTGVYEWLNRREADRAFGWGAEELHRWANHVADASRGLPFALSLVMARIRHEQQMMGQLPDGADDDDQELHRLLYPYMQGAADADAPSRLVQNHFTHIELSTTAERICQVAACVGLGDIDGRLIHLVLGAAPPPGGDFDRAMKEAVEKGILTVQPAHPCDDEGHYSFTSSTYRDAIYSLIPSEDLSRYHAKLGKILAMGLSIQDETTTITADDEEEYGSVFRVVAHLQRGFPRLAKPAKENFARLCGEAGRRSVEWGQFERGGQYYLLGLKALEEVAGPDGDTSKTGGKNRGSSSKWTPSQYDLKIALNLGAANACCHLGNFDDCHALVDGVLYDIKNHPHQQRSTTLLDKVHAKAIQLRALTMQHRYHDAMALGIKLLQKLGEPLKAHHDMKAMKKVLEPYLHQASSVMDRPRLSETSLLEAMTVLSLLVPPSLLTQSPFVTSIAYRIVKISLVHGICPPSSVGFTMAGALLRSNGDVQNASFCLDVGRQIDDLYADKESQGRCLVIRNSLCLPQVGYQAQLKLAYRLCNDVGDTEVGGHMA
jgi:hypothetical protein